MNIQTFLKNILSFLNDTIVPFILAIAFFVFLWNAFRYFILGGTNEDDQAKARSLATWGVSAFVIILSLWGIVNLVVEGFGLGSPAPLTPDYLCEKGAGGCADGL
jgi:succinate dehydrogenase/fumarate reductase cytochrome b subunit